MNKLNYDKILNRANTIVNKMIPKFKTECKKFIKFYKENNLHQKDKFNSPYYYEMAEHIYLKCINFIKMNNKKLVEIHEKFPIDKGHILLLITVLITLGILLSNIV